MLPLVTLPRGVMYSCMEIRFSVCSPHWVYDYNCKVTSDTVSSDIQSHHCLCLYFVNIHLQVLGRRMEATGERAEDQIHGRDGVGSEDQGFHARIHSSFPGHVGMYTVLLCTYGNLCTHCKATIKMCKVVLSMVVWQPKLIYVELCWTERLVWKPWSFHRVLMKP